jgi:hypothetical protein
LQPGGLQDATKLLVPAPGVETAPAEIVPTLGAKLEYESEALVIGWPRISVTVATRVCEVPVATLKLVDVPPETCKAIVLGGQATTIAGVPVVFVMVATTVVAPG